MPILGFLERQLRRGLPGVYEAVISGHRESPPVQRIRRNEAPEVTGGDSRRQLPITRNEGVPGSSPGVGFPHGDRVRTAIANDGLPAHEIKAHTLEKFDRHGKYCRIFNRGMSRYCADNRGYLELFAGSGLVITETGDELDGCPLIAASSDPPFHRLVFVEKDPELAPTLETRLRSRGVGPERAHVVSGDANDPNVLVSLQELAPNLSRSVRTGSALGPVRRPRYPQMGICASPGASMR